MKLGSWKKTHKSAQGIHYQQEHPDYSTSLMIVEVDGIFHVDPELHQIAAWYDDNDDIWDAIDYCQRICAKLNN